MPCIPLTGRQLTLREGRPPVRSVGMYRQEVEGEFWYLMVGTMYSLLLRLFAVHF
jgi:hypothetical protein